ncbi:MAG: hypothetical protein R3C59_12075 [Planctomycetaceae bacterium]
MDAEKLRRRICFEAAQLLHSRRETSFATARWRASRAITRSYISADSVPTDLEIRMALQQLVSTSAPQVDNGLPTTSRNSDSDHSNSDHSNSHHSNSANSNPVHGNVAVDHNDDDDDEACYQRYFDLLEPLDRVRLNADTHPEGDLLYHSLQVFELARAARPWDQDFLIAALLHDVGRGIDPYDSGQATVRAVQEIVSERTLWLIENLPTQLRASEGTIGMRARRRLGQHDDGDVLRLLAECDSEGRVPGRQVSTLADAIYYLKTMDEGE